MTPARPEKLGRYRLVESRGRDPLGPVYLGHDPGSERPVVLRVVDVFDRLPAAERTKALDRFLAEARQATTLDDDGVVTLLDVGESDGLIYVVTEEMEVVPLEAFCDPSRRLDEAAVLALIAAAAETLDRAHRSGVVHRDIHSGNVFRDGPDGVKIGGFGLALAASDRPAADNPPLGRVGYAAPEQVRGRPVDGRGDLFSLGVVLFELLTASHPFPGDSAASVMYRVVHEDPVGVDPPLRPELAVIVARALAKRAEDRFADGGELARALRGVSPTNPGPSASEVDGGDPASAPSSASGAAASGLPPRASPRRRSGAGPFVGVLLLLVLGLAAAWVFFFREAKPAPTPVEPPRAVWLETRVRTEPAGLEVRLDGLPLAPESAGKIRFRSEAPYGVLTASSACREVTRALDPADAGGEVVLVLDPVELAWRIEPEVEASRVLLNAIDAGAAPKDLVLDLCRENRIEVRAPGHHPARVEIPAGATPLEARKLLYELQLQPIPRGTLVLPQSDVQLVFYLDGRRLGSAERELELEAGEHELRFKNEYHWIDRTIRVDVAADERATPDLGPLRLATLVVQAFPSNCKVYVRKPGDSWRYIDETPASRRVATGRYEVKVELNPTGQTEVREVELIDGTNPPVRVSFGGDR